MDGELVQGVRVFGDGTARILNPQHCTRLYGKIAVTEPYHDFRHGFTRCVGEESEVSVIDAGYRYSVFAGSTYRLQKSSVPTATQNYRIRCHFGIKSIVLSGRVNFDAGLTQCLECERFIHVPLSASGFGSLEYGPHFTWTYSGVCA